MQNKPYISNQKTSFFNPSEGDQKKVELLLPVGTPEMALAAIHNGADAIFLGVPGFNARGRSHDFEIETLKQIIRLCQTYKVKVNLAFNIVIFQEELEKVAQLLEQILPLGPDAFIVQDLGLVQLIRKMAPHQRIHASTQMTVTNHEAVQLLQDLDIKRFVLGRENSLDDIKKIKEKTDAELEVFVHGALCVSYSGQCFTSESIGGRSANRGQCAQSCRFSYELHLDGEKKEMGNKRYLVSPQDLCGLEEVPELISSGVSCFKVEGRLKTPEYVATAARSFREAIDSTIEGQSLSLQQIQQSKKEMATSYSRGFFSGWLHGVNHQKLVSAQYSSHRGHEIGVITEVYKNFMTIKLTDHSAYENLVAGDGLLWAKNTREQGGFLYSVEKLPLSRAEQARLRNSQENNSEVNYFLRVELARDIELSHHAEGSIVYQNHDKELKKELSQIIDDKNKKKRIGIQVQVKMSLGEPVWAAMTDGEFVVEGSSLSSIALAQKSGVSNEAIEVEFGSLTGSLFKLSHIEIKRESSESLFFPHKELKNLRQNLISQLTEKREAPRLSEVECSSQDAIKWMQNLGAAPSKAHSENTMKLNLLLREKGQVSDLIQAVKLGSIDKKALDTVTLDFEFGRDYQESVAALKEMGIKVGLATTRILKPNEYRNLKALADLKPDSILVRNLGALFYFNQERKGEFELKGDFSLNVTNHLTASYLSSKGLSSMCLSYDLNHHQVNQVLKDSHKYSFGSQFEVTIFQYMPSFHMEHCVFAAFLSEGSSYRDCGKPCEKHEVRLKDQFQNWHQIKADQECRNTMFNAKSQSASRYLQDWKDLGLRYVRYEALKERGEELISKLSAHIDLINGQTDFQNLMEKIGSIESYGLSEGQFGKEKEYLSRKKFQN